MSNLFEVLEPAWTSDDNELLSVVLQSYSVDGTPSALHLAEFNLFANPGSAAVGRALLWLPGRPTRARMRMLSTCLTRAAADVGGIDVHPVTGPAEFWEPSEFPKPRSLALLAEAVARGVRLPDELSVRRDSGDPSRWLAEVGTDAVWTSPLGRVLRERVS